MSHERYMRRCLELAHDAPTAGEVPVGAIVVERMPKSEPFRVRAVLGALTGS